MRIARKFFRNSLLTLVLPIAIGSYSMGQGATTPHKTKTPTISWSLDATITDGATLASVVNASAGIAGSFVYTAETADGKTIAVSADTVLPAGEYTITANFTPAGAKNYHPVTATAPLTVNAKDNTTLARLHP
jgi:microcystin-dependent protein